MMFDYFRKMEIKDATALLAALGQPTRLAVFRLLVEAGPDGRMPGDIAEALSLAPATLSFHLKELSIAGLIEGEQQGRYICYRANFEVMNSLIEFLTSSCCGGNAAACLPAATKAARRTTGKAARA